MRKKRKMAKYKTKTHKGSAKRFKVTATGKIHHGPSGMSHLMSTKSATRRRRLRSGSYVPSAKVTRKILRLLGR